MSDSKKRGFTLLEVIVASLITAMIAIAATASLRGLVRGREKTAAIDAAAAQARYAANSIRTDMENIYRDGAAGRMKFVGMVDESGAWSRVIFYAVSTAKARAQLPEGDVYEIEYFVFDKDGRSMLCRRMWPNPSQNSTPGGVITTVAEDMVKFELRYFDGQNWQMEWPEGRNMPDMVEFELAVKGEDKKEPVKNTLLINLRLQNGKIQNQAILEQAADANTTTQAR